MAMQWAGLLRIGTEAEPAHSIPQVITKINPNQLLESLVLMLGVQKITIFTSMPVGHQAFILDRNSNQVLCRFFLAFVTSNGCTVKGLELSAVLEDLEASIRMFASSDLVIFEPSIVSPALDTLLPELNKAPLPSAYQ